MQWTLETALHCTALHCSSLHSLTHKHSFRHSPTLSNTHTISLTHTHFLVLLHRHASPYHEYIYHRSPPPRPQPRDKQPKRRRDFLVARLVLSYLVHACCTALGGVTIKRTRRSEALFASCIGSEHLRRDGKTEVRFGDREEWGGESKLVGAKTPEESRRASEDTAGLRDFKGATGRSGRDPSSIWRFATRLSKMPASRRRLSA